MWRSKIKKGFTLLEVMVSLSIFSILFLTAIGLKLNNIRMKIYNDKISSCRYNIEIMRNRLLYNTDFNVLEQIRASGKKYVNNEYINESALKSLSMLQIFDFSVTSSDEYMTVEISGDQVLQVKIQLHEKILGKDEVVMCEFYKGNY